MRRGGCQAGERGDGGERGGERGEGQVEVDGPCHVDYQSDFTGDCGGV